MSRHFPKSAKSWSPLKRGDIVDIIAPASACSRSELQGGVRFLKKMGLVPRLSKKIFAPGAKIFAQSDAERLAQLVKALKAKDSKAIWCVRGGYGSLRLLPALAKVKRPALCKLLIGYSDITTLHVFLQAEWKWPTLHGPLLDRFGRGDNLPQETAETFGLLFGERENIVFKNLKPLNRAARKSGKIKGSVIGGNLATLQSSLGTPWQVLPSGHFVFLEDTGERPHRLDRMLAQLVQVGYFKNAKGVIFGPLLVAAARDRRLIWSDVLPRFAQSLKIPVLAGVLSGHGPVQRPLPLLTAAELRLGPKACELTVKAGARRR
jgi:muramoyltetrapeptide carboxypeptidase